MWKYGRNMAEIWQKYGVILIVQITLRTTLITLTPNNPNNPNNSNNPNSPNKPRRTEEGEALPRSRLVSVELNFDRLEGY